MLGTAILRLVDFCARRSLWVLFAAAILTGSCAVYTVKHFAVNTDTTALFPPNLPWAQRAFQYMRAFPEPGIIVVVEASTPENVEQAASKLAAALAKRKDLIRLVREPQGGAFFKHDGLLYLPTGQVEQLTQGLTKGSPLIATLAADPSLHGSLEALSNGLAGVRAGYLPLDAMTRPMEMASDTAQAALAGRPAHFSWQALASGHPVDPGQLRRFIEVDPVLDYHALEPGRAASNAIEQTARELKLGPEFQASIRLTGLVPINDDGFATLTKNAGLNAAISLAAVGLILWLALRWGRLIFAVVLTISAGLAASVAFGLFLVGALNLISVAFLVLFIGLGIDFGIQFGVRYRAERYEFGNLRSALRSAARKAGPPLALAAAATAVGFGSFVPTDYRGLSELGEIAGAGMVIAFLSSITLLPALLAVLKPPLERAPMGFAALAPVDRFLGRHRMAIVVVTIGAIAAASPLLMFLRFDFNPLHLRDAKAPSVATFLELRKDPQIGANAIEVMTPNLAAADALAQRLSVLPQVAKASTLDRLIPADQDRKLELIRKAAAAIEPSLNPQSVAPPPSDRQTIEALNATAASLSQIAANKGGPGAEAARRLSGLLVQLAQAQPDIRQRVETAIGEPLKVSLDDLRQALQPQHITRETIPAELKRQWLTPDGSARVQVLPKGDPDNTAVLRQFVTAVLAVAPNRDRTRRAALRGRENGGARVCRGRSLCDCRDRAVAGDNPAPGPRRAVDPDPIAGRRHRDVGIGRRTRHPAQLCQYHRSAFAARGRRRLQDLLHARLAQRPDGAGAIDPNPGRDFQRDDNGNRLWQPVDVRRSRHVEHGRADGAGASFDDGGGGAVPAGADGPAAQGRARLGWQPATAARAGDRGAARGAPGRT